MANEYHPWACRESVNLGGVYICRLGAKPCALHNKEKCYKQTADEGLKVIQEILKGKDNG